MRLKSVFVFCLLAASVLTISAPAQEGHPLAGVWYGDWGGAAAAQRNDLTVVLQWNGKAVTGQMNPGPDMAQVVATLDSSKWTVHIEGACQDKGAPAKFVADGKIEDLGFYNRRIVGTASCGTTKGDLKLKRD